MSGHYDPTSNIPLPEMIDQSYPMYDNNNNNNNNYHPYPRLAGPSSHYDGVAFWYRPPNSADSTYERDQSIYSRGVAISGNAMDGTSVKHRRTRSGCFTCRSRRVKCDEARPICERCKKGGRDCEFPQDTSSKRLKHAGPQSPQEVMRQESKETLGQTLDTIKDESEPEHKPPKAARRPTLNGIRTRSAQSHGRKHKYRQPQDLSPSLKEKASPQSSTSSSARSLGETSTSSFLYSAHSAEMQARQAKIKLLRRDIQKYLDFQHDHMTHYHYFFKLDPTDFIHNEFIDQALSYEPLLYAVTGFAAYHYELRQENANLSHFLNYHSKALVLLRKSLEKHTRYTEAMLLTVLQLATVEEYLGDWVNLVGHHKAAHTMLTQLFEPANMMESNLGRRIFSWYARFDVIVGLMGGSTTRLPRPWFETSANWYHAAVDHDPGNDVDIDGKLADFVASNRLLGFDMASLFAKVHKDEISIEGFRAENAKLVERLQETKKEIESLNDGFYTVTEFPVAESRPLNQDDIVNPYRPEGLFKGALWDLNLLWMDWSAIDQMQKYQASLVLQQPPPAGLMDISLEQCRIYEAIDRYPEAPEGAILGAHTNLGLATVFLKKDGKHTMWARQKLAGIERLGYIFPLKFRSQMAQLWGLSKEQVGEEASVEDWWLPNGEGKLPILSELRKVVLDRHASSDESIISGKVQDVRDLKSIFAKLDLRTQTSSGVEETSPQSESARSVGSRSVGSTSINSPSSATSLGIGAGEERWVGSQASGNTVTGKGKPPARGDAGDRMSGVWS